MSLNPTNIAALPAKQTADNGASFAALLQPVNRVTKVAPATDAASAITQLNLVIAALVTVGLMKAS